MEKSGKILFHGKSHMQDKSCRICILLLCLLFSVELFCPQQIQAKNYDSYSTESHGWYIMKNSTHERPAGGIPAGMKLQKYHAYYMNTKTDEKVIYLSFDCGYEAGYTAKILDTLKKHDAKAIFFVTKQFLESQPELVKRMKEEGHFVGNHTLTHPDLSKSSEETIKSEIKGCAKLMKKLTGYDMDPYLRPPMGNFSEKSLAITKDLGYNTMFWSIAYLDYDVNNQPGKKYVVKQFEDNYHKGAMPLIHTVSSSNCKALDTVLTNLEKRGYRFGTVDEFTH